MKTPEQVLADLEQELDLSEFDIHKEEAVIRQVDGKYCVFSESGKKLGCYKTRKEAVKRLRQIEYFKKQKGYVEEARQECYCKECGYEFFVSTACHLSLCPECGDDNLVELTGIY